MYNKICPLDSIQYTIQAGDTLWRLSQTYGLTVQSILDQNPGINPQNLQIGSTLCIPRTLTAATLPDMTTRPTGCQNGTFPYTIQAGDTLWKLSQTYGVSVQSILDQNPSINPQNLQIGSTICIPTAMTSPKFSKAPKMPFPPTAPIAPIMPTTPVPQPAPIMPITQAPPEAPVMPITQAPPEAPVLPITQAPPPAPIMPEVSVPPKAPIMPITQAPTPSPIMPIAPVPKPAPIMPMVPIPPELPYIPPCPSKFTYCIKRCDSLCGIARKFHVSVKSILRINPGLDPRCLCAGTYIFVPINCCAGNTIRYSVMAGDTLNSIAKKFSIAPSALIKANPNIDFNCLVMCQFICIPNA